MRQFLVFSHFMGKICPVFPPKYPKFSTTFIWTISCYGTFFRRNDLMNWQTCVLPAVLNSSIMVSVTSILQRTRHPLLNPKGEYIIRKILEGEHYKEFWERVVIIGRCKLTNLRYVEDITLIISKVEEIEILLKKLEAVSREYGFEINWSKMKIMIVDRSNNNRSEINEISAIEVVDHFTNLGSDVDNWGGRECKISKIIQMMRNAMTKLNRTSYLFKVATRLAFESSWTKCMFEWFFFW